MLFKLQLCRDFSFSVGVQLKVVQTQTGIIEGNGKDHNRHSSPGNPSLFLQFPLVCARCVVVFLYPYGLSSGVEFDEVIDKERTRG